MKYLEPNIEIIEFKENIFTDVVIGSSTDNIEEGGIGGTTFPKIN